MESNTTLLMRAKRLAQDGDLASARECILQAVQQDDQDYEAWWALAQAAETDRERLRAVKRVLALNPAHFEAQHMLDQIQAGSALPLRGVAKSKVGFEQTASRDYALMAVLTLVLYFFIWFAGLALNVYFILEARRFQQKTGEIAKNAGCLYVTAALGIVPFVCICGIVLLALAAPETTPLATMRQ